MWDRFAATAALAGMLPICMVDVWVVAPWIVLVLVWVIKDHRATGHWDEEVHLSTADKNELRQMLDKNPGGEPTPGDWFPTRTEMEEG